MIYHFNLEIEMIVPIVCVCVSKRSEVYYVIGHDSYPFNRTQVCCENCGAFREWLNQEEYSILKKRNPKIRELKEPLKFIECHSNDKSF